MCVCVCGGGGGGGGGPARLPENSSDRIVLFLCVFF